MLNSYSQEIKIFIKKVFLFWLPLVLIFLFLEALAYSSGELWTMKKVVSVQAKSASPILFNRRVVDQDLRRYKYLMTLEKKPEILVLGSSRIMQIREEMLDSGQSFYNAGGIFHNAGDLPDFLNLLPAEAAPRTIILGVDLYWFGEKSDLISGVSEDLAKPDAFFRWESHLYADNYIAKEIFKNPKFLQKIISGREPINNELSIGFQALRGNGFRSDGSFQYGIFIQEIGEDIKYLDRGDVLAQVKKGTNQFKFDSVLDEKKIALLGDFLDGCRERGIKVVGIAPPFSSEITEEFTQSPHQKDLFSQLRKRIPELFEQKEYEFFDYTELSALGLSDLYMFDGMHVSETGMAKILADIEQLQEKKNITQAYKISADLLSELNNSNTNSLQISWQ